jgi:tRNA-Thr(GGU) m(6)t(6)A37 methyltransferase TsaA
MDVTFEPIGYVAGGRTEAVDDEWGGVESTIVLDDRQFDPDATLGLEDFSHIEVVYLFHLVKEDDVVRGARRPRGNPDWPSVGILAQRAKARPNRIGVSRCELLNVDRLKLQVRGLDAVDGSPVLDVKPFMVEFAPRGPVFQPEWASDLMRHYW